MKCLIVSNVRGYWPALQAVLAAEPDADRILCLGDLVGDGPQPAECVKWAMQLNPPNCVVCAPVQTEAKEWRQRNETEFLYPHSPARLTPEMQQFFAGLQPFQQFEWRGAVCFACQRTGGQPLDAAAFARLASPHWNATELTRLDTDLILTGVPGKIFVLVGHPEFLFLADSGRALLTELNGTMIVNPGCIGQPSKDDSGAAYAVWQDGQISLRQTAYGHAETVHGCRLLNSVSNTPRQCANNRRPRRHSAARELEEPVVAR